MRRERLEFVAEILAAIALCAAPLALGLVHLPAVLAFSSLGWLSLALLVVGRDGKPLRLGWFPFALLGFSALMALQLLPLPFPLLRLLSPSTAGLIELTLGKDPGFRPLTLDVGATAAALVKSLGWTAVAVVLQHRSNTTSEGRKRVRLYVALSAGAVAVLGLGHFVVGEKRSFLGLYEFRSSHHFRSSFGNSNHLAGFLSLGGLLALGLALHAKAWKERLAFAGVFLAAGTGALLSASRGGFGGLLAGLLILPVIGWGASRKRQGEEAAGGWKSWLTLGGATALVTAIAAWIYIEFPRVLREVESLFSLSPEDEAGKVEAAQTAWAAAKSHWLTGIGRGAFESVGTHYQERPFPRTWFTHAENEPLQALAELGIPLGAGLVAVFALAWMGMALRGRRSWAEAGAAAGVFAISLQNLVDFSLQGASGLAVAALAAYPMKRPLPLAALPASLVAGGGAALILVGSLLAWPGLEAENERLVQGTEGASRQEVEREVQKALRRRPADWVPVDRMATFLLQDESNPAEALPWINRRLLLFPQSGHGQVLAGEALASLGRGKQARGAFRAAAELGVPTSDRLAELYPDPEAILEGAPLSPVPANHAAGRLARQGKTEEALAVVLRALERAPSDRPLLETLQGLRSRAGEHEEALSLARRLREMEPSAPRAWTREAEALVRLGLVEEARALYEEGLLSVKPVGALVFGLASLEIGQKRGEQALRALERLPITSDTGTRLHYHSLRASAFRQEGSLVRARDELRISLRLAPDREALRIALADVLGELGQFEEAREELAFLDPDRGPVASARKRLEERRKRYQEERGLDLERLLR